MTPTGPPATRTRRLWTSLLAWVRPPVPPQPDSQWLYYTEDAPRPGETPEGTGRPRRTGA
jgi:hypothetical protein